MTSTYTAAAQQAHIHLLDIVHNNLTNAADWSSVTTHPASDTQPRPLLTGLPPEPIYIDPDVDSNAPPTESALKQHEYVLPVDLREKWSVRKMAEVFDAMPEGYWGVSAKGEIRKKRLLLAVVSDDSTVVYYFVHDGIVKPRQN
jgi:tRNA-splicing endonuclease subunit Sen15